MSRLRKGGEGERVTDVGVAGVVDRWHGKQGGVTGRVA
jgi:hypothetical protein